jgi:hypothetical protein
VRVYADFQKLDDQGRLVLLCYGTLRDLTVHRERLREGATFTFYADSDAEEDLEADGVVSYVPPSAHALAHWVAAVGPIRYVKRPPETKALGHPCFGCRRDLQPFFEQHGRSEETCCPHCGMRIMAPVDPPEAG